MPSCAATLPEQLGLAPHTTSGAQTIAACTAADSTAFGHLGTTPCTV
jgi:hypothetical protein